MASALLSACELLAHDAGAPVFGLHTASFMDDAVALYERMGYRRTPEFDVDLSAHYGSTIAKPVIELAYVRRVTPAEQGASVVADCEPVPDCVGVVAP
jgi:ribosomal protein S18 acetylase RimI-like enzyme